MAVIGVASTSVATFSSQGVDIDVDTFVGLTKNRVSLVRLESKNNVVEGMPCQVPKSLFDCWQFKGKNNRINYLLIQLVSHLSRDKAVDCHAKAKLKVQRH